MHGVASPSTAMTDQYYYNCLVPDAIKAKPLRESDVPPPVPPPPRPPRSQATYSSPSAPASVLQGSSNSGPTGGGQERYYASDYYLDQSGLRSQHEVRGYDRTRSKSQQEVKASDFSPRMYNDGIGGARIFNDLERGQSQSANDSRSPGWSNVSYDFSQTHSRASISSNLSPTVSPKWNKNTNQQVASPPYDLNMSVSSDPSPVITARSPELPERSQRRHTIDYNIARPLMPFVSAESSPPPPVRHSRHGSSVDEYSSGSFSEFSPLATSAIPKSAGFDYTPSYEYPPSTPRHHEVHQVCSALRIV